LLLVTLLSSTVVVGLSAPAFVAPVLLGSSGSAGVGREAQQIESAKTRAAPGPPSEQDGGGVISAAEFEYDNRAYPRHYVTYRRTVEALHAFRSIVRDSRLAERTKAGATTTRWRLAGPTTVNVPQALSRGGGSSHVSGRVTAMAIGPTCNTTVCRLWVGAAGGGIWRTRNALSSAPTWLSSSSGLSTNAIGSIVVDPNDPTGQTLYVGTGEPNTSNDSEAGLGLYRSTNGGATWSVVPGSVPVSKNRSIASIAVDPTNANHIFIATAPARHGASSVWGGRQFPPEAPKPGLYESLDQGAHFTLAFSRPPANQPPLAANFKGGVNEVRIDPNDPATVYVGIMTYGIWRRSPAQDGDMSFHHVFRPLDPSDTTGDRTEFALADTGAATRIYAMDGASDLARSEFWRVDDANRPHSQLMDTNGNVGWTKLSSGVNGTFGFGSYNICRDQCSYDEFVASPPGKPDYVWIGGVFAYNEYPVSSAEVPRSNGRAVMRSTNSGVLFTDMTADAQKPPQVMHPDQHAIVFDPQNPDIAFIGSDGGVVRTSGAPFVDKRSACNHRGLSDPDLTDCRRWLSAIPARIFNLNRGLSTLQFQSITLDPKKPSSDAIGGTQDNGTLAYGGKPIWNQTIYGDGGQSTINRASPNIRMHTYFSMFTDVNFHGNKVSRWDEVDDPLRNSNETASFYIPLVGDPVVGGADFAGLEHVWRTKDNGGHQAFLDRYCGEFNRQASPFPIVCGDWKPLGGDAGNLTGGHYGLSRSGEFVSAVERSGGDRSTLWAGTRTGRVFISRNALAAPGKVRFRRLDKASTPGRFVSGIFVDSKNPNRAWVSFSGYNAYTPKAPGHVFQVTFDPRSGKATWRNVSYDLGDQPVTDVVRDLRTGALYASTDLSVYALRQGANRWRVAAPGLPRTSTFALAISQKGRVLWAATHGRSAWKLRLP
jgi:hypothetical protein